MHGRHSFSRAGKLWWSPRQTAASGSRVRAAQRALARCRDRRGSRTQHFPLLRCQSPVSCRGLISDEGLSPIRSALHRLMKLLALRIDEASQAPEGIPENKGIPSGYTYLMQLIAHDMVDSVISAKREDGTLRPATRNARGKALMLDTLYGAGPDELSSRLCHLGGRAQGQGRHTAPAVACRRPAGPKRRGNNALLPLPRSCPCESAAVQTGSPVPSAEPADGSLRRRSAQ